MGVKIRFSEIFEKSYIKLKNAKERAKAEDALDKFRNEGIAAPHFKYLTKIDKKLKAKGLVLCRLKPLTAASAHGAWRILLREEKKEALYAALDIQPHENCYRAWKRRQKSFL